jgi:UDP-N-acetylmuramoyl-L-alanyl-D-glutamate--2,6-diaminopimelate ligase
VKLAQLLSLFPQLKFGETAASEVLEVTQDSRAVKPGSVFVAIRGASGDGHRHLAAAAGQGAIALVVEDPAGIPSDFKGAVVRVASTRRALDLIAQRFFGEPAKSLFCVAVTGTNGKTTITYMVESIFSKFGWPTGVMGTIDHHLKEKKWPSALTTPDSLTLHRRLKEFVSLGAQAAAFEVSSHALTQHRTDSLPFAVGIFTNFTRDHLDYHKTMEEYFAAKERLFGELLGRHPSVNVAVLNADDSSVRNTRVREGVTTWWYGRGEDHPADFSFRPLKENLEGTLFHLSTPRGNAEFHLPCTGLHNVYNAVAATAAALAAGVSLTTAQEALAQFRGAPGRLERVRNKRGLNIFIDYAHTDDALATVLKALSDVRARSGGKKGRIVTVFGCGGDRDRGKRPLMAQAAARYSDAMVITSDNPRTEDPIKIIEDIRSGVPREWRGELKVEPDRRAALRLSLQM